jgi:hypothetical protein
VSLSLREGAMHEDELGSPADTAVRIGLQVPSLTLPSTVGPWCCTSRPIKSNR